ncbi:WGxxGxxG family protein [Cohnella cellulosilytica]|uniref:WGxxGxxG family protein n=1 Tax=Cohnella cellulosilytica TaxID=986710 RepID=A0ABW2FAS5_9BACL
MGNRIKTGLSIVALSLTLAAPAYANTTGTANGGNGGMGNGMGTQSHHGAGVRAQGVDGKAGRGVSVYGTGTGSQFRTIDPVNPGVTNSRVNDDGKRTSTDGRYRAAATSTTRGSGWGWLGLLGLLGLVGFWNRNPQRNR